LPIVLFTKSLLIAASQCVLDGFLQHSCAATKASALINAFCIWVLCSMQIMQIHRPHHFPLRNTTNLMKATKSKDPGNPSSRQKAKCFVKSLNSSAVRGT